MVNIFVICTAIDILSMVLFGIGGNIYLAHKERLQENSYIENVEKGKDSIQKTKIAETPEIEKENIKEDISYEKNF